MATASEGGQTVEARQVYGRLRLKHLQLLEILGRTGNIGKAASELNLTQSAASKILQDAEDIFATPLFGRSVRGLSPTIVGQHVIRYAQRTINRTAQVVSDVGTLRAGGAGSLAIGAIMASMTDVLPAALVELRRRRPYLVVHLTATTSDEIVGLLDKGQLELGLCRLTQPEQAARYAFEELFDEEYRIFVAHDHPLAGVSATTLADLVDLPWVMQPRSSPSRQVLQAAFAAQGLPTPRSRLETTSRFALLQLVQRAGMISLLPSTLIADQVARGDLISLPLDVLRPPSRYGLVTRRGEAVDDHVAELMAIIREVAAGQP